ncbi:hypothetical protein KSF_096210 [Reticulibacter mediterranei]|uniref:SWIM-type domain-containing protein n=1 Tax=Reticulibacter mediterranei TaxID=2778369 RepID=A0A8J3ISE5_9CHLR|nr:hypothetical protein [Reticulibacter mediterranei]GHO99573.1 hypothetical protein KSF_096210 [Reticulibacter mediterranei]
MTATTTRRSTSGATKKASAVKPYTPAALFRVYDKKTGAVLGYAAPARNGEKTYHVTCDEHGHWDCDCPATVEHCVHVKAAMELCGIRVKAGRPGCKFSDGKEVASQIEAQAQQTETEQRDNEADRAAVDPEAKIEEVKPQRSTEEKMLTAPLNGNRRFPFAHVPTPTPRKVSMEWLCSRR